MRIPNPILILVSHSGSVRGSLLCVADPASREGGSYSSHSANIDRFRYHGIFASNNFGPPLLVNAYAISRADPGFCVGEDEIRRWAWRPLKFPIG